MISHSNEAISTSSSNADEIFYPSDEMPKSSKRIIQIKDNRVKKLLNSKVLKCNKHDHMRGSKAYDMNQRRLFVINGLNDERYYMHLVAKEKQAQSICKNIKDGMTENNYPDFVIYYNKKFNIVFLSPKNYKDYRKVYPFQPQEGDYSDYEGNLSDRQIESLTEDRLIEILGACEPPVIEGKELVSLKERINFFIWNENEELSYYIHRVEKNKNTHSVCRTIFSVTKDFAITIFYHSGAGIIAIKADDFDVLKVAVENLHYKKNAPFQKNAVKRQHDDLEIDREFERDLDTQTLIPTTTTSTSTTTSGLDKTTPENQVVSEQPTSSDLHPTKKYKRISYLFDGKPQAVVVVDPETQQYSKLPLPKSVNTSAGTALSSPSTADSSLFYRPLEDQFPVSLDQNEKDQLLAPLFPDLDLDLVPRK